MTDESITGNFNYPTDYRIGAGRVRELSSACTELGISRPLIVTDSGVTALHWFDTIRQSLSDKTLFARVFSDVDSTLEHVNAGIAAFKDHYADGCILPGGGSAMDTGKCIVLLADNPGTLFDYEDVGDNWKRADSARIAPSIAIPTTAGTGSEVGRAAVIVDPELTVGLPPRLTAATGMDALAHCFEAFCAPAYHPIADGIALEGMRLIANNLVVAFDDGDNITARTHLLMAASMGATAFQKGLGLIHALSHPLAGLTGVHHGTKNAIFHPYAMVHHREVIAARMPRIARAIGLTNERFEGVLQWILDLRERLELPHTLAKILDPKLIPRLVPMAMADPSLLTNPKPCTGKDLERVLSKALSGDLTQ